MSILVDHCSDSSSYNLNNCKASEGKFQRCELAVKEITMSIDGPQVTRGGLSTTGPTCSYLKRRHTATRPRSPGQTLLHQHSHILEILERWNCG